MSEPSIVVVHNNIDERSAIGKLAAWAVRSALAGGHPVIAVARDLDPALAGDVRHVPLHVPRRIFAYQWARALGTVRQALTGVRYDVLHTYQPQLTGMADTWHVQFLTRSAGQAGGFPRPEGARRLAQWTQLQAVAAMEDRRLRRVGAGVDVLFPGEMMREEFTRLYGVPPRHRLLANPAPPSVPVSDADREAARRRFGIPTARTVVGYLGGLDERKGWRELVEGLVASPGVHLLMGGSGTGGFGDGRLAGRCTAVGYVDELTPFFLACDVLAVPSRFDPYPVVVTEAAAHGVPSITTAMVGSQADVLARGAGLAWDGRPETLPHLLATVGREQEALRAGAQRLATDLSEDRLSTELRAAWTDAHERRQARRASS